MLNANISDELLFILITIIDLTVMLACWKAGRRWLELFVVLNYVFANLFVQKFTDFWGFYTSGSAIFYAAIFMGTDIITEHYGKKAGFQMIWKAFFAIAALMVAQQLVLLLGNTEDSLGASEAMEVLFSAVPRITFASLIAFIIVQRFDIWLYHWIHKKTKGKMLWLRNIVSTSTSQVLDSVLFFGVAFYGVLPSAVLLQAIISGIVVKLIVALIDTPFIYLSYWVKGRKLSEATYIPDA